MIHLKTRYQYNTIFAKVKSFFEKNQIFFVFSLDESPKCDIVMHNGTKSSTW